VCKLSSFVSGFQLIPYTPLRRMTQCPVPLSSSLLTLSRFTQINASWDPASKVIILFVDAALNIFFIQSVKKRLVKYHGLTKYAALVTFNARLLVSICMDVGNTKRCNHQRSRADTSPDHDNRSHAPLKPNGLYSIPPCRVHGQAQHRDDNGKPDQKNYPGHCF
jgi:hypothetical protein